eukprot:437349-Hanusia_phi.AAC.1
MWGPDGKRIAGWSRTCRKVWVWEVETGRCQDAGAYDSEIISLSWETSGDGINVGYYASFTKILVCDVATGIISHQLSLKNPELVCVGQEQSKEDIAALSYSDKMIRVWDVRTGKCVREFRNHDVEVEISKMSLRPDGKMIATHTSLSAKVFVLEVETGKRQELEGNGAGGIEDTSWGPDGKTLASLYGWEIARVWDLDTGEILRSIKAYQYCNDGNGETEMKTLKSPICLTEDDRLLLFQDEGTINIFNRIRSAGSLQALPKYEPDSNK